MSSWMNPCHCAGQSAFGQDADRKQAHELVSTFPSPWRWWHGVKERLEEMEKTVMTDTGPREFAGVKLSTRASQGLPPETVTLRQVREFICKQLEICLVDEPYITIRRDKGPKLWQVRRLTLSERGCT